MAREVEGTRVVARRPESPAYTDRPVQGRERVVEDRRRKKGAGLWWLLGLLALALLALLLYFGLRDSGDDNAATGGNVAAQQDGNANAGGAGGGNANAGGAGGGNANAGGAGGGNALTAGGQSLLPVPAANMLSGMTGERVTGNAVPVQSVVSDEAFWVGTSEQDRMFVRLERGSESPFKVRAGENVSFDGVLTQAESGLARELGVNENEGASLLAEQGVYVDVKSGDLRSG